MEDLTALEVDGTKLKTARESCEDPKLSLSEAARRIGVSRQYLWNIENSLQKPGADVLARLCALYRVPISDVTLQLASAA